MIEAYIYISRPVQAIAGIVYLGNKTNLEYWKEKYSYDVNAVSRIDEYLMRYKVVMEIQRFQNTTQLPLEDIRKVFPKFLIPQMYYYLDDLPLIDYIQDNLKNVGDSITHEFNDIESSKICVH